MQVLCKAQGRDAAQLRDAVAARVRFVLRRLNWTVPRARVWMTDLNGPRGGLDKRCRVQLSTPGKMPVVVTAVAHDWRNALDAALARAAHALRRLRQRIARPVLPAVPQVPERPASGRAARRERP